MSDDLGISSVDERDTVELDGGDTVNSQGCCGRVSVPVPDAASDEIKICEEFSQSLSLDSKVQKHLNKCKTFPVSRETPESSSASGTSSYARSISLPSPSTLVSAMKGGRAQNGTMTKSQLRVKWASEVYDPPSSSMSHTVNRHQQQRPKAKKKDKYRHKGKSSRGNGGERKHGNRSKSLPKTLDPRNARLQASCERLDLNGFGKSKVVDIFEYGISSQEAKCGSSFLREALPKVHLPMGEAS